MSRQNINNSGGSTNSPFNKIKRPSAERFSNNLKLHNI